MPELTGPTTDARADGAEAFPNLYHMSATAGRGTQEYVAINQTAVAGFLLGLGSLLALVHPILLLVPLAAVVCAIISMRQVRLSNGTQTSRAQGIPLSLLGLLLGLGIGGFVVGRAVLTNTTQRADRQLIADQISRLGQVIGTGD